MPSSSVHSASHSSSILSRSKKTLPGAYPNPPSPSSTTAKQPAPSTKSKTPLPLWKRRSATFFSPFTTKMAHHFRTTHNNPLPVPPKPGGTTAAAASSTTTFPSHHHHHPFTYTQPHYTSQQPPSYSYTHPHYTSHHSHSQKNKHVHFDTDDYRPSALSLKIKFGPRNNPTSEIKISVYFEDGKLPRVKVKTKRPKEQPHRKRKRTYVEEQDGRGRAW